MGISLDDRSLQRPVQGRTAAEFQRLKEGDKLRLLDPAGQYSSFQSSNPTAKSWTFENKGRGRAQCCLLGITENGHLSRWSKFAKSCTGKNCSWALEAEGDKLRLLAPACQMPAARAPIRQPNAKPGSAPLKAPPPLKATEGQEVKPVLILLNDVTASKSVSKANDS